MVKRSEIQSVMAALPVPAGPKNFGFISQSFEIPDDVVLTAEHSVRVAQTAIYPLLGVDRQVPPVTRQDKTLRVQFEALVKTFK